ncbi:hypothetical protein PTKIN_Ptkin06aG0151800 [Pterospermum kingtungense]
MDEGRDPPPALHAKTEAATAKPESNTDFPMLNRYSIQDLEAFTDNFNSNNLIGITQFGQVYRGEIVETGKETRTVSVKTLKESDDCFLYHDEIDVLLNEELKVLTLPNMNTHPNLIKLIGYCCEEQMKGVVYDLNPMDTLHNVMTRAGLWDKYSDVYSYGVILIELITKRITEDDDICRRRVECTDLWALKLIKSGKSLDVHQSLQEEACYKDSEGRFLVKLGLHCIEFHPDRRPSSSRIVKCLEHLSVVRNHGNEIGL